MSKRKDENEIVVDASDLTDAQKKQLVLIKEEGGTPVINKCAVCGKILVRDASIEKGEGDRCEHVQGLGIDWVAHYASMSAKVPPVGYIKVADAHRALVQMGYSISSFVKAFGEDRGLKEPVSEDFRIVYVGKTRWLPETCLTKGLKHLTKATRAGRPKGFDNEIDVAEMQELLGHPDA